MFFCCIKGNRTDVVFLVSTKGSDALKYNISNIKKCMSIHVLYSG